MRGMRRGIVGQDYGLLPQTPSQIAARVSVVAAEIAATNVAIMILAPARGIEVPAEVRAAWIGWHAAWAAFARPWAPRRDPPPSSWAAQWLRMLDAGAVRDALERVTPTNLDLINEFARQNRAWRDELERYGVRVPGALSDDPRPYDPLSAIGGRGVSIAALLAVAAAAALLVVMRTGGRRRG